MPEPYPTSKALWSIAAAQEIDGIAGTRVGQGLFSHIAEDLSGEVQVSKPREDAGYLGKARSMFKTSWGLETEVHRDESHDIIRIAIQDKLLAGGELPIGDIAAHGGLGKVTSGQIIIHELTHATYEHISAAHIRDEGGYIAAYNPDGSVKDLAMHVANQYGREIRGEDPSQPSSGDLILYNHADFKPKNDDPFSSSEIEEARIRANLEQYGYMQAPGMNTGGVLSPAVSGLSGLAMTEQDFTLHAQTLARDAITAAGGKDYLKAMERPPELADAKDWLTQSGGDKSDDAIVRRANHEVESALRVSAHRDAIKDMSIDGSTEIDARIDAIARRDPEAAIALFEEATSAGAEVVSIAAARDIMNPEGIYAKTKTFLAAHDAGRREYALGEAVSDIEDSNFPGSGLMASMRTSSVSEDQFFDQGRPAIEVQKIAMQVIATAAQSSPVLSNEDQQPPHRRRIASRSSGVQLGD
jgi:hypothetical protein